MSDHDEKVQADYDNGPTGYGSMTIQIFRPNADHKNGEEYWTDHLVNLDIWEEGKEDASIMFEVPFEDYSIQLDAKALKILISLAIDRWAEYAH